MLTSELQEQSDYRPPDPEAEERFRQLKRDLHQRLISALHLSALTEMNEEELRQQFRTGAEELCRNRSDLLSRADRERLVNELVDETLGLGPLEPLLRDSSVSDILVNGPKTVYIERQGRLEQTHVTFYDDQHLLDVVQRIAHRVGRRVDEACPMVDARLADGSRVNAVIRPLALDGALLSIRRFPSSPLQIEDLINYDFATPAMIEFLGACVLARLNILISGGTGSGKTTLLNALTSFIPNDERIATIEDAAELQIQQPHVARMETRPPNLEGLGEVTARELLRNSLRMRPDRIIVGECRGGEAFDMLQAMSTGHAGSLTTVHANDARDAIARLEMLVGMAGYDLPLWLIQRQIASSIHIVVHVARLTGGLRRIVQISEVTGMQSEVVSMHDLFVFQQSGVDENRIAQGTFHATGLHPTCLERFKSSGIPLSPRIFERREIERDDLDRIWQPGGRP